MANLFRCSGIGKPEMSPRFMTVPAEEYYHPSHMLLDKRNWDYTDINENNASYYGVTYGKKRFVAVGESGSSMYSDDGEIWIGMSGLDSSITYRDVTYGNGRFVCVGDIGSSYYSTDGETWIEMTGMDGSTPCYGVCYGNDRFIAVGSSGLSYYSIDGETWTLMNGLSTYTFRSVTYGNGRFVCVGNRSQSYYSTDGETWIEMTGLDVYNLHHYGVTCGNGMFVSVASTGGRIAYSIDGETWEYSTESSSFSWRDITYGAGVFMCVGTDGCSKYSEDGITWSDETIAGLSACIYYSIAYSHDGGYEH